VTCDAKSRTLREEDTRKGFLRSKRQAQAGAFREQLGGDISQSTKHTLYTTLLS
jgi:hypothetical protein